ncbi:MAG: hypothetical protein IKA11_02950 [Clostridia bacterium]|nr:hypothetical protein [Clostridia bacterium]
MYNKICSNCGCKLSDFYNTGMLGCEECYRAFNREVLIALKKIQGKTFHVGKTPKLSEFERQLLAEYQALIKEKEKATIEGRFSDIKGINQRLITLAEELKSKGLI